VKPRPAGRPAEETGDDVATLYLPCGVCRAPIAVVRPSDTLPQTLACPVCSAVLRRGGADSRWDD
jgi:hypothetical protein